MTQIEKMRAKLLEMSGQLQEVLGTDENHQNRQLFEWAEQWCKENLEDSETIAYTMSQRLFWNWWKTQIYIMQSQFMTYFYRNKHGITYLLINCTSTGDTIKESNSSMIRIHYNNFMEEGITGVSESSTVTAQCYHNFTKSISQTINK